MKKTKIKLLTLLLAFVLLLSGCVKTATNDSESGDSITDENNNESQSGDSITDENNNESQSSEKNAESETAVDLGGFDDTFGEELTETEVYEGYFEEELLDITVTCISGTQNCYTFEGNTLTFTEIGEDSVYSVSGKLKGNIVIDVGDDCKFELEMQGLSLVSDSTNPIFIKSGDKVSLTAKKDRKNYIYDVREAVAEDDEEETVYSGAVYSMVDLEICGKGSLTVISENNNGIHTKDDLQVKNLTLFVSCADNALKGNDSVEITNAVTTLIAKSGDGIKTSNSNISDKGNQHGTVTILGGMHTIYAACDGIDAAYDVIIDDSTTVLNIYTDKYSAYSEEVTAIDESVYYIRYTSKSYKYSVKYYNSEEDFIWVNAEYHSAVSGGRTSYYYYSFPKKPEYSKMQVYIYSSDMEQGQEEDYLACSEYLMPSTGYDTFALSSSGNSLRYSWTNYTTSIQGGGMGGMGGMQNGNTDKGDHSTKGIKAANEIRILAGTVNIKAYDDAIHANNDTVLDNGAAPTGNMIISGGTVTVYSNDDGIHADGTLTVSDGTVSVVNSYEGLEGRNVVIAGGNISVISSDDGINGTATSGTAITVSGGTLYVYAGGDALDSNSRTSYSGIVFSGGNTVVISTSNGNSAIDSEQGYQYTGGSVIAVMSSGGMTSESMRCQNFSSIGTSKSVSLPADAYLTVEVSGKTVVTVKIPKSMSGTVIYLGSNSASFTTVNSTSATLDRNGVCWE